MKLLLSLLRTSSQCMSAV